MATAAPTPPSSTSKKKRKQRTIKNGLVCLDDVIVAPGEGYINWIPSVKAKLKEREVKLLRERMRVLQSVIEMSLEQFAHQNRAYFFEFRRKRTIQVSRMAAVNLSVYRQLVTAQSMQSVIAECTCFINATLSKWNGVKESKRLKTQILEFRKYFAVSKNWFDQIKLEHMASHFWIPVFNLVQTMSGKAAAKFFSQRMYAHQALYRRYLNMLILENLLRGTLKIANSRERLLIPAGAFRSLKKNVAVFKPQPPPAGQRKKSKKATSKETREAVLQCVVSKASASKHEFEEALYALHEEVDHYQPKPTKPSHLMPPVPVMAHPSCCSLKVCGHDKLERLDFGDVGMTDLSSPSTSLPPSVHSIHSVHSSLTMDPPSPLPPHSAFQSIAKAPFPLTDVLPFPPTHPLSSALSDALPDPFLKASHGTIGTMGNGYKKPEMPEMPYAMTRNHSDEMRQTHPAWQQPFSSSSIFDPFSSNNGNNAWHQYSR